MKRIHPGKIRHDQRRKNKIMRKQNKFRRSAERQERRRKVKFQEQVFQSNFALRNEWEAQAAQERMMRRIGLYSDRGFDCDFEKVIAEISEMAERARQDHALRELASIVADAMRTGESITVENGCVLIGSRVTRIRVTDSTATIEW